MAEAERPLVARGSGRKDRQEKSEKSAKQYFAADLPNENKKGAGRAPAFAVQELSLRLEHLRLQL